MRLSVVIYFVGLVGLCTLLACSGRTTKKSRYEFELVTIQQQALDAISATPTEFIIDFGKDRHAWERAAVFFSKFTSRQEIVEGETPEMDLTLSNQNASADNYHYQVQRRLSPDGYKYLVQCFPNRNGTKSDRLELAVRNARNLARFIRDGTLEVSLLDL